MTVPLAILAFGRLIWGFQVGDCDFTTADRSGTIVLGSSTCHVVGAGDLITIVNPTPDPITISTQDDEFYTPDVLSASSEIQVPGQGTLAVRIIHAGQVSFSAAEDPTISGMILILGRGGA